MSHVTTVLISDPEYELEDEYLDIINRYLIEHDKCNKGFTPHEHSHCAGPKSMQGNYYFGAFNYLDIEEFINLFNVWQLHDVSVIINDEHGPTQFWIGNNLQSSYSYG